MGDLIRFDSFFFIHSDEDRCSCFFQVTLLLLYFAVGHFTKLGKKYNMTHSGYCEGHYAFVTEKYFIPESVSSGKTKPNTTKTPMKMTVTHRLNGILST